MATGGIRHSDSHVIWKMMSRREGNSQRINRVTQQGRGIYKAGHAIPRLISKTVEMTEDMEQSLLRYKWINYWRHMLQEDRIISKSFKLFTLYCTESISDAPCFVSHQGCVERATSRITPPAICLPLNLWSYRSTSSFTSEISHRNALLKSHLLGK